MNNLRHNDVQQTSHQRSLSEQFVEIHERIREQFPQIARISFALYEPLSDNLKTYADSTPHGEVLLHYEYPLGKLPRLKDCAEQQCDRYINDLSSSLETHNPHSQWLREQRFGASLASPVYYDDEFIGFIFINTEEGYVFNEQLCQQLSKHIETIRRAISTEYETIHKILDMTSFILRQSPKHLAQTRDHQERMYHFTKVIARGVAQTYQLDDEQIDHITLFSRLHDIGKLSLPHHLLLKPDGLAVMERKQVVGHIEKGIEIMESVLTQTKCLHNACIQTLKEIIAYHHELMDGSGYPFGLKDNDIPVPARIITVANIFDALTSHRPYKQARSVPLALLELEKMVAERKLDKHCVNALRNHQEFLKEVIEKYPEPDPSDIPQ
ncbi:HD-GYP domain-containing protein [Vibrio mangrovi]|uniref:Cyclic di-GMP phosphodiesterase response regulator RpfG n=1 Tax=Vibrio mangrovi TaxID=474394 RepID=A0A1Y6ITZ5_9VIBR|nr:HD domain-containing phosphohydrolase [Vibrio mangrovi]MDW6001683.1 HD domain-containing phosphohydrolase [Vibrio mangrovi]SMS00290.1 Cyclic di-GMP phosphodiesterase response regulator RpfG [Vibrio mangrovi]